MRWAIPKIGRQFFIPVAALIALSLLVFWGFKIGNLQRLRSEIVQVEGKLSKGQELWRNSPPLTPREKEGLEKAQQRLLRMLPKEKDVPSVLQEVSRVARDYNLVNLSLSTAGGAAPASPSQATGPVGSAVPVVVAQSASSAPPATTGSSGPIDFFVIKVTFGADYQEIAHFLEALQKIPRLVTIQSLQLQRNIPLVVAEVIVNAYYLKGDLTVRPK